MAELTRDEHAPTEHCRRMALTSVTARAKGVRPMDTLSPAARRRLVETL